MGSESKMCSKNMSAMGLKLVLNGELQEVLRTTLKPTKSFLYKVLELLLDVLEMLLDVLDLSCRPWTCPGMARMVRMATIVPS